MRSFEAEHYVLEIKLRREKIADPRAFPYSLPAIAHLDTLELHPHVTFIVGENGSGKCSSSPAGAPDRDSRKSQPGTLLPQLHFTGNAYNE